ASIPCAEPIHTIAQRNGKVQHHAGIAVTIGDASGAAIAHHRGGGEVPDRTEAFVPVITPPHVIIPIHIKTLVASVTNKLLGYSSEMALHVGDAGAGIVNRELVTQVVDGVESR